MRGPGVLTLSTDGIAHSGTKSIKVTFVHNEDEGAAYRTITPSTHIFYRFYTYFTNSTGGDFDHAAGQKIARLSDATVSPLANDMVIYASNGMLSDATGINPMKYMAAAANGGSKANDWPDVVANISFESNRWYCVEWEVKLNSLNQSDGETRMWVDGNLVTEQTGIKMIADNQSSVINYVMFGGWYSNGAATLGVDPAVPSVRYIDDLVISNSYIGPISVGPTVPVAPTGLTATAGNATVGLIWTASAGATSYNIYRSATSGGEGATAFATSTTPSYTDNAVTNNATYYYKVAAANSAGTSAMSKEAYATPSATAPPTAQTISFNKPAAQTVGTLLTLSATATSGLAVSFTSTTLGICTVSGTTASFIAAGTCTIDANQAGNSTYAAAPMVPQSFKVNAAPQQSPLIPAIAVAPSSSNITMAQPLSIDVEVAGAASIPTGTVTLTGVGYTSSPVTLSKSGRASITIPAGSLAVGADTLTVSYSGDSNYAVASSSVTVTVANAPPFTITGTPITVAPGATTGNTSTITVTPASGFTGGIVLTAAITSTPSSNTLNPPVLSFDSSSPVKITSNAAGTATLTVLTTAIASRASANSVRHGNPWYTTGGAALACILLFGIPARRRNWRSMLGMLLLLVILAGGMAACANNVSGPGLGGGGTKNSGTTAGDYTVTVIGASGTTTATCTITLTVK
jgi:hypothetical protein